MPDTRVNTVASAKSRRRELLIRQAEGYLDLVNACGDFWEPTAEIRDPLVYRALDALSRLSDRDRRKPDALYLTGQAFRAIELYRDAISPLREAALFEPENIHIWLALAWCYKRIGRLDRAIESLEEALTVDPGDAIIHYNLACYWSLAGSVDVALAYLGNAFEIDESFRDLVDGEVDFDPIREHPAFRELTSVAV
jgi:tetratricopeptide (TPR) repeat protein